MGKRSRLGGGAYPRVFPARRRHGQRGSHPAGKTRIAHGTLQLEWRRDRSLALRALKPDPSLALGMPRLTRRRRTAR